jgi:hypothetical protein
MCSVPKVVAPSGVRTITSGPGATGTGGAPLPGNNCIGTSTEFTGGAEGDIGFSSGSLVFNGGGGTP